MLLHLKKNTIKLRSDMKLNKIAVHINLINVGNNII